MNQPTDPRPAAAEALSKLPGMDRSPWGLVHWGGTAGIRVETKENMVDLQNCVDEFYGSWLRIEDGNPWSSAAFLARAKYVVLPSGGDWWCLLSYHQFADLVTDQELEFDDEGIRFKCPLEMQETANILGIVKLYEIDPKAYNQGMGPLLED